VNPSESFPFTIISPRIAGGLQTGLQSISPKLTSAPEESARPNYTEEEARCRRPERERWREIGKIFSSCTRAARANLLLYTTKAAAPGIWIGHLPARAEKKALRVHEGERGFKILWLFGAYWYARGAMLYPFHCRLLPRAGIFSFYFIALYMQVRIRCLGW
jgi:hypothetical protein